MWEREGGREITFHNLSTEVLLTIYHRAVNRCTGVHTKMWSKHNTAYNIYYTILLIWYILYYLYDIYYTTYITSHPIQCYFTLHWRKAHSADYAKTTLQWKYRIFSFKFWHAGSFYTNPLHADLLWNIWAQFSDNLLGRAVTIVTIIVTIVIVIYYRDNDSHVTLSR